MAYFVCEVISGPHANSRAEALSLEKSGYQSLSAGAVSLPTVGKHTSGLFGLQKNASNRDFDLTIAPAYNGPTLTYKITAYWAEVSI